MHKQNSSSKYEALLLTETKEHNFQEPLYTSTPKQRRQPEFMSPYFREVEKDLFSQLLGTETKLISPLTKSNGVIQLQYTAHDDLDDMTIEEEEYASDQLEQSQSQDQVEAKEDMRKRKRKSNAQLKLLKQEFDRDEGGWNKDRIVRMAEITGLSESQVYKWCWDQKKKTTNRRFDVEGMAEQDQNDQQRNCAKTRAIKKDTRTKRKLGAFQQQRQLLINKRLLFN